MGDECEDSFAEYTSGFWGCTVVAARGEEWVVRFDNRYGHLWYNWKFDDEPESELSFQRTGREIVYWGHIESSDGFYKLAN